MGVRISGWVLAVFVWIGVIFFSSTSWAGEWCEEAYSYLSAHFFGDSGEQIYARVTHLLAEKGVHVTLFATLAILLWGALGDRRRKVLRIIGIGLIVGSMSEFLQRFFPNRDPAIRDVAINVCGATLGALLCMLFSRRRDASRTGAQKPEVLVNSGT